MKSLIAMLAMSTALTVVGPAMAGEVTFTTNVRNFGWGNAYLALYVTDANGKYAGSLWVAGSRPRYYEHLIGWYRASGGNYADINGITGPSIGAGRSLKVKLNLNDAVFDAGYELHIDAAAENYRESPNEIVVPLTAQNAGKSFKGSRFISDFTFTK